MKIIGVFRQNGVRNMTDDFEAVYEKINDSFDYVKE